MRNQLEATNFIEILVKIGNLKSVDFDRGNSVKVKAPYVWGQLYETQTDFDILMKSGYLFARKFDEKINSEIINKIAVSLKENIVL